jgi:hypothetical protein
MTTQAELARDIALSLIIKSGVREYEAPESREAIARAAVEMAAFIWANQNWNPYMALPDSALIQTGTEIVFRSSGGDAAITMTSVANAAGRQSVKADFGATRARYYDVFADVELAATPTAGNLIDVYLNPSGSATAGTDNLGNCSGTDAAHTGYSSNLAATVPQLIYVGSLVCTAQATSTVQSGYVGRVAIPQRYGSIVVVNNSGAAFHSAATNVRFRFVPVADTIID